MESAPSTALECLGEITTNVEIGHVSKSNIRVLVIKNLNFTAILAMGTLEKFGRDWTHKTLTLGDVKLVVKQRSHESVILTWVSLNASLVYS
jgi:hypothetical protein